MTVLSDTEVSTNRKEGRVEEVCCYATPCLLENGDLVAMYRTGSAKHSRDGKLLCSRSTDKGSTWSEPSVVYDGLSHAAPESAHNGHIWRNAEGGLDAIFQTVEASRPDLYVFSEEGRKLPRRCYRSTSNDAGGTWSAPEVMTFPDTPRDTFIGTRPILLENRDLFIPLEITASFGQQSILATFQRQSTLAVEPPFICADDPTGRVGYGDPRITRFPDGRLIMLLWTYRAETEETIEVHRSLSENDGASWSAPEATGVLSQIMTPLALDEMTCVAASNVRLGRQGIRLWLSADQGVTWDPNCWLMWDPTESKMLGEQVQTQHTAAPAKDTIWDALPTYSFGTPDLLRLPDRTCLLMYYATIDGICHIRACRFRVSL